jgi:integrase/recombinase XerD
MTFERLTDDFLAYLEVDRGLSRNTLEAYRCDLRQLGRHLDRTGQTATALGPAELAAFIARLAAGDGRGRPASAATLQRKAACLRSFYRHLRRRGIVATDPTAELRGPPHAARPPRVLTRAEVASLIEGAHGTAPGRLRDRAVLELLYASGLRASELIALELADLDRARRVIVVPGPAREVPVGDRALEAIDVYVRSGRPALVGERIERCLFVNHRGGRLSRQGLYKIVQGYAEAAGLAERMSPNTLRHSFAAHALADGGDLRALQAALGHADISTTRVYRNVPQRA